MFYSSIFAYFVSNFVIPKTIDLIFMYQKYDLNMLLFAKRCLLQIMWAQKVLFFTKSKVVLLMEIFN